MSSLEQQGSIDSFDLSLPIVDLRTLTEFTSLHLKGTTHLPWPELQQRLAELPPRPATIQLVGATISLEQAIPWLQDRGYHVQHPIDTSTLLHWHAAYPGLFESGTRSKRLWQPNGLVAEWVHAFHSNSDDSSMPLRGMEVLDLGCGGGRTAVFLAGKGAQVLAIDNQHRVLDRAKALGKSEGVTVHWQQGNLNLKQSLPNQPFDAILMLRYLNRSLMPWITEHLAQDGYVIFQTFSEGVEAFGSPKNPNFILKHGELVKTFADFKIIVDRIDTLADGRPVASFIAQKTGK